MSELPTIPKADFYHGPHDTDYQHANLRTYLEQFDKFPEQLEVVCSNYKSRVVLHVDCDDFVEDIENEWCGPDGGGDPDGVDFSELKTILERAVARFLKKQNIYQCERVGTVTLTAEQCRQIVGGP